MRLSLDCSSLDVSLAAVCMAFCRCTFCSFCLATCNSLSTKSAPAWVDILEMTYFSSNLGNFCFFVTANDDHIGLGLFFCFLQCRVKLFNLPSLTLHLLTLQLVTKRPAPVQMKRGINYQEESMGALPCFGHSPALFADRYSLPTGV